MEERRRSSRLGLECKLNIKQLDGMQGKQADIEIIDMSRSGIGFYCPDKLTIGSVYEGDLIIWTKEVIHVFLEIVRMEEKGNTYSYGAFFVGMSEMDASRISIYETVREYVKA